MRIMERLRNDKELQDLKKEYKIVFDFHAPGFNYDEYSSVNDYKEHLKKEIEDTKELKEKYQSIFNKQAPKFDCHKFNNHNQYREYIKEKVKKL